MFSKMIAAIVVALILSLSATVAWADAQQDFNRGAAAEIAGNDTEAVAWFRKAADQGNAAAQLSLGLMYYKGDGVTQDFKQQVFWICKAADQGYAPAQGSLAEIYFTGSGVPQDFKQAVFWYRKAAENGFAGAQFNLGLIYAKGDGVTQDYVEAYKWFTIAAANGIAAATKNREVAAKRMTPAQIAEAQTRASDWIAEFQKRQQQQ